MKRLPAIDAILTDAQRALVLSLARKAVFEFLNTGKQITYPPDDFLQIPAAAFVTLKLGGELRGCIGSTRPEYPLGETIIRCAISAATQDPRFPRLTLHEYPGIHLEVSILSGFREISSVQEIEPGVHGVMISAGYYRGLLLPQVAVDHHWDRDTFFAHVCHKAGLPTDTWPMDDSAKVEVFCAQVFAESG